MIRVAATADVHFGADSAGTLRPHFERLTETADLLVVAGDITRHGEPDEAAVFAEELEGINIPKIAVLGNHDYHTSQEDAVTGVLEAGGITVLECGTATYEIDGITVGVAGMKGFGGGFAGACGTAFGEPEMKAFVGHTRNLAERLRELLLTLHTDVRIVVTHYSPAEGTVVGERLPIYPFLGSYLLGEAIDHAGAHVAFHGHAHSGTERGVTPGGIHVRNVAQPVIRQAYAIFNIAATEDGTRRARLAGGDHFLVRGEVRMVDDHLHAG